MTANAETLYTEVEQFITESRALLEQGALMELAGLDARILTLCQSVLQLSPEDRASHEKKLEKLLLDLTQLGKDMAVTRDALAEEIRGAAHHQKASVAYRTTDAVDGFGKKEEEE